MKTRISRAGALALAFTIAVLPAEALAERGSGSTITSVRVSDDATAEASTTLRVWGENESQLEDEAEATSSDNRVTSSERMREVAQQRSEQVREIVQQREEKMREQAQQRGELIREMMKGRIEFMRESTTTRAFSLDQLKQTMRERKQELDDDEASTTPKFKQVIKNANDVRLAVHTLLASKELLGGIGPQVSEIAKRMNDSLATTTNAEAKIESRGFFTKLFFGGDKKSADTINQQAIRNQENIVKLTDLLNQASTTDEVKAELTTQIVAMQAQLTRLQDVASSQAKLWGFFSWRF